MRLPLVPDDLIALLVQHGGLEGWTPRRAYVAALGATELVLVNAGSEDRGFLLWGTDRGGMALAARPVDGGWLLQALPWEDEEYVAIEAADLDGFFAAVEGKWGEELPAPEAY